jgi:hypothetical protein
VSLSFPGFRPVAAVRGIFGDANARVVSLPFHRKKPAALAVNPGGPNMIASCDATATRPVATSASTGSSRFAASTAKM